MKFVKLRGPYGDMRANAETIVYVGKALVKNTEVPAEDLERINDLRVVRFLDGQGTLTSTSYAEIHEQIPGMLIFSTKSGGEFHVRPEFIALYGPSPSDADLTLIQVSNGEGMEVLETPDAIDMMIEDLNRTVTAFPMAAN